MSKYKPIMSLRECMEAEEKPASSKLPVKFGIIQQGKFSYVGKMLAEGKSWRWISATIGWEAKTLKEHWLTIMESI